MNTIKDAMFQPIFESVMDSHMQHLLNTIKSNGMNVKDVLVGWNSMFPLIDQVDPSMVRTYRNLKGDFERKLEKLIKDKDKDSNCMIVCCVNYKPAAVIHLWDIHSGESNYNTRHIEYIVNVHDIKPDYFGRKSLDCGKNVIKDAVGMSTNKSNTWASVVCEKCNEVWIIDMSEVPMKKVMDIRQKRFEEKRGMIQMNEETFKKIVQSNRDRYKVLAQKMRDQKGDAAKQVMERANKVLQDSFETLMDFRLNMKKYMDFPTFERMSNEVRYLANMQEKLIDAVNRAMKNDIDLRRAQKRGDEGYWGVDYYYKHLDEKNEGINKAADNCEGYMESLKQLMDGKENELVPFYTEKR